MVKKNLRKNCISVIVPVYNVEQYLQRCLDSVLSQTWENLDIIIVDDGSPDSSPKICDEYQKKDSRIRVIHKQNGGLASARNTGLDIAEGEYLFFLDSDDWLETDGLEILITRAQEYNVDFVRYRAIRSGWPGMDAHAPCNVEAIRELTEGLYTKERILEEIYPRLLATEQLTMGAIVGAWGSLYRTDFLLQHNLRFYEEVKFSEDLIFSANVVKAAKSFYFIDTPGVYHYFYNPNSISKSFRSGRWDSCRGLIKYCEKDFSNNTEYDFSKELHYLRWFCIMLSINERRYLSGFWEKRNYCKMLMKSREIKGTKLNLKWMNVNTKQKLIMLFIKLGWATVVAMV